MSPRGKDDSRMTLGRACRMCEWQKQKRKKRWSNSKNGSFCSFWETQTELKKRVNEKMEFYEYLAKGEVGSLVKDGSNKREPWHVGMGEAISEASY